MRQYVSFYFDAFKLAIQSIFAHKLRAFLTLIGNIIGVASVVVVGASVSGGGAVVSGPAVVSATDVSTLNRVESATAVVSGMATEFCTRLESARNWSFRTT